MGFFKESDWIEEEDTDVVDTVAIAKAIRENESVKNEIKTIFNEEGEDAMSDLSNRISILERKLSEIEVKPQSTVGDNDLMNRISLKITEYKNEINYIDNQINTLYGRAFRNGGNVDESQVNKLENEMNTYKKKIELLEPIYEVLKEV